MRTRLVARTAGVTLSALTIVAAGLAPALAATPESTGADPSPGNVTTPNTPDNNELLPLVNVKRPSSRLKPNPINPRPVCNALEDHRTVIYQVQDTFTPIGAIEMKNASSSAVPLSQELSKTQSIALKISGDYGKTFGGLTAGLTAVADNLTGNISATAPQESMHIQPSIEYSLSWTAGQQIGPYQVPAGHTGKATYGFRQLAFKGTQQRCLANGTWSNTWAYHGLAPLSNAVVLKVYGNPASEAAGTK